MYASGLPATRSAARPFDLRNSRSACKIIAVPNTQTMHPKGEIISLSNIGEGRPVRGDLHMR